jgi:predicted Fe-Mo cluster-binding NifX family protein
MKICLTSAGPSLDSEMDPRFGRCQYFILIDPETMAFEAIENSNLGASGGAGIQSSQFVSNKSVEAVITGQVGPNAYSTLQAAGIKIITGGAGKIREMVEKFKNGQLSSFAQGPTARAHFGMGSGMGRGLQASPPNTAEPSSHQEELNNLKEQSKQLRQQLNKVTEQIERLETPK